jgi:hypothetical protein
MIVSSGDSTTSLISLITLLIAAFTLYLAGANFLKMREPFVALNIKPQPVMSGGLTRGINNGAIILSYRNATTNNMLNDFSIKGTICCKNKKIDFSNMLPAHIQLAPSQNPPDILIEAQKIAEQNGIILDAPDVNLYVYFDCSYIVQNSKIDTYNSIH